MDQDANPRALTAQESGIAPMPSRPKSTSPPSLSPREAATNDSGYGTGASNTPSPLSEQSPNNSRLGRSLLANSKYGDLQQFDQPVSAEVVERYKHIRVQLESALVQHITQRYRAHTPMIIRLTVLGRTEDCAKPWIVVFCSQKRLRHVRRFFSAHFAQDLCQPQDEALQSFEVLVRPCEIQLPGSETSEVITDLETIHDTLSGAPIMVLLPETTKRGTLGGLIKVGRSHGDFDLYGLTAAHLFNQRSPSEVDEDDGNDSPVCSDDDCELSRTPELDITDVHGISADSGPETRNPTWNLPGSLGWTWYSSKPLTNSQSGLPLVCEEYDCGIVSIASQTILQPNRLRPDRSSKMREADLLCPPEHGSALSVNRNVALNVSSDKVQSGILICLPCSVWLGERGGFVPAFPLQMNQGSAIKMGDSGSWVVEPHTSYVYGHLVASDPLGDGYIIPLRDTLQNIKEATGAELVELASSVDIAVKRNAIGLAESRQHLSIPNKSEICRIENVSSLVRDGSVATDSSRDLSLATMAPNFRDPGFASAPAQQSKTAVCIDDPGTKSEIKITKPEFVSGRPQGGPISSLFSSRTIGQHSNVTRGDDIDRQVHRRTPQQVSDAVKRNTRTRHEVPSDDDDPDSDSLGDSPQNDRRRHYADDVAHRRPDAFSHRLPTTYQAQHYEIGQQPELQYALSSRQSAPRQIAANHGRKKQDEDENRMSGRHSRTQQSEYLRSLPSREQLFTAARSSPSQGLRRGYSVQDDRSRGSDQERQRLREFSTSPHSSYPKKQLHMDEITSHMTGLWTTTPAPESNIPGESLTPEARRDSSHSLSELARNNFDFDALVITEHLDDRGESIRRHTKLQAMVDTGSDLNIVSKRALSKAGIDQSLIEDLDVSQHVKGFEGSKFALSKRVPLIWGKAKHNGQQTRRGYFYVVNRLPDDLEMLIGRKYLRAEIDKHVAKQRARSQTRNNMQNRQEEDGELSDWVVMNTNSPR